MEDPARWPRPGVTGLLPGARSALEDSPIPGTSGQPQCARHPDRTPSAGKGSFRIQSFHKATG
jgi:hypothetical protein